MVFEVKKRRLRSQIVRFESVICYAKEFRERNSGKIFAHIGEERGENLAKTFADCRPSISSLIFFKWAEENSQKILD